MSRIIYIRLACARWKFWIPETFQSEFPVCIRELSGYPKESRGRIARFSRGIELWYYGNVKGSDRCTQRRKYKLQLKESRKSALRDFNYYATSIKADIVARARRGTAYLFYNIWRVNEQGPAITAVFRLIILGVIRLQGHRRNHGVN